jgi:hypothetical protein
VGVPRRRFADRSIVRRDGKTSAIAQIRPANQADSVRLSISKKASGREGRLPVAGKRIEPADTFRMPAVDQRDAGQQRRSEARRYRQQLIE